MQTMLTAYTGWSTNDVHCDLQYSEKTLSFIITTKTHTSKMTLKLFENNVTFNENSTFNYDDMPSVLKRIAVHAPHVLRKRNLWFYSTAEHTNVGNSGKRLKSTGKFGFRISKQDPSAYIGTAGHNIDTNTSEQYTKIGNEVFHKKSDSLWDNQFVDT